MQVQVGCKTANSPLYWTCSKTEKELKYMSFANNLKQVRKERGLSQEELAEIMDVSRQAVSKWEQGESYPEVEKLLLLSNRLNISLDHLFSAEIAQGTVEAGNPVTGTILISSPHENVIVPCYKVSSSQQMSVRRKSPQYALFGVSIGGNSFWGEPTTFLGWYATKESITKEVSEIHQAIMAGKPAYKLQYSAKVERKWMRISMVDE